MARDFERAVVCALGAAVVLLKVGEVTRWWRSTRMSSDLAQPRVGDGVLMAHSGNDLAYSIHGAVDPVRVYLLCHGLGASSNSMLVLADALCQTPGTQVILYDRAGYRRSRIGATQPFTIAEAVDDLHDLVGHTCPTLPVTLVGHSLGGYIAHRYAEEHADKVDMVWLVEPTHPQEVRRVAGKREGVFALSQMMRINTSLTQWGAAALKEPGEVASRTPNTSTLLVGRLEAESGSGQLWRAMHREWATIETLLLDGAQTVPLVPVPVGVIASDGTLSARKEHHALFAEYSSDGQVSKIRDADHLTIVLDPDAARGIAELLKA